MKKAVILADAESWRLNLPLYDNISKYTHYTACIYGLIQSFDKFSGSRSFYSIPCAARSQS